MRVVLITTPTRVNLPNSTVPAGILSLAAYLESLGHEVRVIDAAHRRPTHHAIAREAADFAPHLVGVGGIITAYAYIIGLTHALRRAMPDTPIVLGGQVTINTTRLCFGHMPIDYIIHGYGEIALAKLVEHLEGRRPARSIPGLSHLEGGRIATNPGREFFSNLDEMPLPAYRHVDMEHYATVRGPNPRLVLHLARTGKRCDNFRSLLIMGAVGCVGKCTFCVHEQEYVGLRLYSPEYLVRHMTHLKQTYDINVFGIGEEMYIVSLEKLRELNSLIMERLPGVFWETGGRAENYTPEVIRELDRGNAFGTGFGVESFSTRILKTMKKATTRELNLQACEMINRSGVVMGGTFIVGNVGEDQRSIDETVDGIRRSGLGVSSGAFYATPYPGGRIWDWAVERGIIGDEHAYLLSLFSRDAYSFSVNLTPHPDWVVHFWMRQVMAALERNAARELGRPRPGPNLGLLRDELRTRLYFLWRGLRRRLWTTQNDRKHSYEVDATGALLPARLNKGLPHLAPRSARLARLLEHGPELEPLEDNRDMHRPPAWWRGTHVPLRP